MAGGDGKDAGNGGTKDGRDILSLCNGCYLSLEESRQALEDASTRAEVNTVLGEMGLHYGGTRQGQAFRGDHQGGGRGEDQVTDQLASGPAQVRRPSRLPYGQAVREAQGRRQLRPEGSG